VARGRQPTVNKVSQECAERTDQGLPLGRGGSSYGKMLHMTALSRLQMYWFWGGFILGAVVFGTAAHITSAEYTNNGPCDLPEMRQHYSDQGVHCRLPRGIVRPRT
jgi:hypothetical protein